MGICIKSKLSLKGGGFLYYRFNDDKRGVEVELKKESIMCEDIRVYCEQCATDVRSAGYVLVRTENMVKCECDKCNRQGYEYKQR